MTDEDVQAQLRDAVQAGEVLQGQLQNLDEQLAYLGALTQELQRGKLTLASLKDAREGEELLMPVGGGTFVPASLRGTGKVLLGIGSGLHVEGTVDQAVERLDAQLAQARDAGQRLQEESRRVTEQLQAIEEHVGQLTR
jgi:prefoldin alpha subunit